MIHKKDQQALRDFLVRNGQALLPMVELIEHSALAVDELIDVLGWASIEAVLRLSAEGLAGPPHPGKKGGALGWHGGETGTVCLSERKLRVHRPRLRKKDTGKGGEVPIPAYEAMQRDGRLGSRADRTYDEQVVMACGEKPAYGYRRRGLRLDRLRPLRISLCETDAAARSDRGAPSTYPGGHALHRAALKRCLGPIRRFLLVPGGHRHLPGPLAERASPRARRRVSKPQQSHGGRIS